jgi:hypothetical protein
MEKKRNFNNICIRGLKIPPPTPCALGRQRAESELHNKNKESHSGCPWFVNSEEHNYCFWSLAQEMDGQQLPDKEIAKLNCLETSEVERVVQTALKKLQNNVHASPEIQDWIESVIECGNAKDDGEQCVTSSFPIPRTGDEQPQPSPVRRNQTYPLHHKGDKVDIYGITSKKSGHKDKRKR